MQPREIFVDQNFIANLVVQEDQFLVDIAYAVAAMSKKKSEHITERLGEEFLFFISEFDGPFRQIYGITTNNVAEYFDDELIRERAEILRRLAERTLTLTTLKETERNYLFSPDALAVNIAWCNFLSKLAEDYDKTEYAFVRDFFGKVVYPLEDKDCDDPITIAWDFEKFETALYQYMRYLLRSGELSLKYEFPMSEKSCVLLKELADKTVREAKEALQNDRTWHIKILENIRAMYLAQLPDITDKSKQEFPSKVPSLMFTIFNSGMLDHQNLSKLDGVKGVVTLRLTNVLRNLITELTAETISPDHAADLVLEGTQAVDHYKSACNLMEKAHFEMSIEKQIKTVLDPFETLASACSVHTQIDARLTGKMTKKEEEYSPVRKRGKFF